MENYYSNEAFIIIERDFDYPESIKAIYVVNPGINPETSCWIKFLTFFVSESAHYTRIYEQWWANE